MNSFARRGGYSTKTQGVLKKEHGMENSAKKQDQRVRLTKALLQNAFLELLAKKPVQSITVKELCDKAGINRGSFYNHYQDIYDLLEQMEQQIMDELQRLLDANPVIALEGEQGEQRAFVQAIFTFFEKNRELCAILLGEHGDKKFVAGIIEMGREKSIREYRALYPGVSPTEADLFYAFIAWGFIGLLEYGIKNPGVSAQTLVDSANKLVGEASRFFL